MALWILKTQVFIENCYFTVSMWDLEPQEQAALYSHDLKETLYLRGGFCAELLLVCRRKAAQ